MGIEQFGKFSAQEAELKRIRQEAIESGGNPEDAVRAFLEKLDGANARLREKQSEAAIKTHERLMSTPQKKGPPSPERKG